jgi:hypothetical protein
MSYTKLPTNYYYNLAIITFHQTIRFQRTSSKSKTNKTNMGAIVFYIKLQWTTIILEEK